MKKSDIYEVTIKIVGIVATFMCLVSLISSIIIYMSFLSIQAHININPLGIFQTNINIMTILPMVMYGLFGYLLLFKTDKILNILRLSDSKEMTLHIEKKTFYHIVVLLIGFSMFTYSSCQLISYTYYKPEVSTTQQTSQQTIQLTNQQINQQIPQIPQQPTIVSSLTTTNKGFSTNVNYVSIVIFLLSILILIKSVKFSEILMPKEKE